MCGYMYVLNCVAFRCTACEAWCHNYCRNLVPYNCGVKDFMDSLVEVCVVLCCVI